MRLPHPAIRVALLVALAGVLPLLGLQDLALTAAIVSLLLIGLGRPVCWRAFAYARRARWLLLSLGLAYLAMIPGEPLLAALPGLSREGGLEALRRVGGLLLLIVTVAALQGTTPAPQLAAAVALLLSPLRVLGVSSDRFALRLALALHQVATLPPQQSAPPQGALAAAAARIAEVERRAAHETGAAVTLPRLHPVPRWQWLLPLLVLMSAWSGGR